MVGADKNHVRLLHEMLDDIGDEELLQKAKEIGVVRVFREHREEVLRKLKEADPEHWERFAESQIMASKNVGKAERNENDVVGDSESAVVD
jgi:hypothetical protein